MKSPIQSATLVALASILKPIVKLILQTGLSYSEFIEVAKSVFVHVASKGLWVARAPNQYVPNFCYDRDFSKGSEPTAK